MSYKKDLLIPQFEQKTAYSCIPACLQQVFGYFAKPISQKEIMKNIKNPQNGMSIPAAGAFAKKYGFRPIIITNNINIFDPSWFNLSNEKLLMDLQKRKKFVNKYNQSLINDYLEYLKLGGRISFKTINQGLLTKYLSQNIPIIMELSSTFLYKKRKSTKPGRFNDAFKGEIEGHGIVVAGFDKNKFKVVDPDSKSNPYSKSGIYWVFIDELIMSFASLEGKSLLLIRE